MEKQIYDLLSQSLKPALLEIRNDSHLHQGHASSPGTGRSHYSITIVSEEFIGKTLIQRHQMVYSCLKSLMNNPIHALSIKALTPDFTAHIE